MSTSLQIPPGGDAVQRVTPLVAEELKEALLPKQRSPRSPYLRNLIRRVQRGFATPHVHAYELMAAKRAAGESEDNVLAFPRALSASIRLGDVQPVYQDYATLCDSETEMEGLLNRVQLQLCMCVTPGLIRNALDAIARYRARLDALEAFLRARLASMSLTIAR